MDITQTNGMVQRREGEVGREGRKQEEGQKLRCQAKGGREVPRKIGHD